MRSSNVTFSVLNAVPAAPDMDAFDVYVGRLAMADKVASGELETSKLKAGTYDIVVVPEGTSRFTQDPVLREENVSLRPGTDHTLAVHLSPTGRLTSSIFTNETQTVGRDMGRLTFRHIAQAPKVDVRTRGSVLMPDVRNGTEDEVGLRSGNYKLRVVREGSRDKLLPASTHPIENAPGRQDMGDNRIIYLWGSDRDDSLQLSIQEIPLDLR